VQPPVIHQDPYQIAPDTWIVPQIEPAGPDTLVSINSMVIAAAEPVIVDTGCFINRDRWMEQAFSIVDPADVRWVYLTHSDRDHVGNLDAVLAACPQATLITTQWGAIYMLADGVPPLGRMRWVNDGDNFDAGDRTLHAVTPPLWDGASTRGLYDPVSGVYWAADCFATYLTHPVTNAADLDPTFWTESILHEGASNPGWHALVDPAKFDAHVERSARMRPSVVASAHGPTLTGPLVEEGYRLICQLARTGPVEQPGQPVLDAMVAAIAAAGDPAAA
jgi:flavorubredoxin